MSYHVIKDFNAEPGDTYVSANPYWIVAVYRLLEPATYLRLSMSGYSSTLSDAVKLRGDGPLIVTDDCLQLQVSSSKSSHLMSLSASLMGSGLNYLSEIFPGDYIMAWMFTNLDDYERVRGKIQTDENTNEFSDGLKFFGRVQSLRKQLVQNGQGIRQVRYQLNASGFSEFDSRVFFDPHLIAKIDQLGHQFAQLGIAVKDLLRENQKGISATKANSRFLDILFGTGIPVNDKLRVTGKANQVQTGGAPDAAFIIPTVFGSKFGIKHNQQAPNLRYTDILEKVIGLQKYDNSTDRHPIEGRDPRSDSQNKAKVFTPIELGELLGAFLPIAPQVSNNPVWGVLQQYLNPAANEMFTCLRVNADGRVMPTYVMRQLPFTSEMFDDRIAPSDAATDAGQRLDTTRFMTLPRWIVDPVLVKTADIGRSDALRYNFVHVYGENGQPHGETHKQIVRNPPIRDDMDIARSGLRSYMATIPCSLKEVVTGGPGKWMALLSDIVMGQHMTLTGILQTVGIQAPICIGDNLEWEGAVFHIEGITHNCQIAPTGQKDFTTTLNLTHGVHDTTKDSTDLHTLKNDLQIYAGINLADFTSLNPGVTADIVNEAQERQGTRSVEPGSALAQARQRKIDEDTAAKNNIEKAKQPAPKPTQKRKPKTDGKKK